MQAVITRMSREIKMLQTDPPPGVWAGPKGDSLTELEAQVQGPVGTVYEGGVFSLEVNIPARYPFEPPKVRFVTKVYHPNIDGEGRICLDLLNMPPKGAWKPSLNISTVLASIGLLLSDPNPDDGLVADITQEFKHQRQVFDAKARQHTQRYAMQSGLGSCSSGVEQAPQQQHQQHQQQEKDLGAAGQGLPTGADAAGAAQQQDQMSIGGRQGAEAGTRQQAGREAADENTGAAANQQEAQRTAEAPAAAKRPRLTLRK